jgi:hypothetical protein
MLGDLAGIPPLMNAPCSHREQISTRGSDAAVAFGRPLKVDDRRQISFGGLNVPPGYFLAGRRCLVVDYICDTAIIRVDEDYRIVAILDEERMGTCLRHLDCNFGRQRVKLDVLWYGLADRLRRGRYHRQ